MKCDILIHGCKILDTNYRIKDNISVAIQGNTILSIFDSNQDIDFESEKIIDGKGKLLLPGFVDGHTHVCQQLLRGRTTDEYPMIWTRFLVPFESNLSPTDVRVSTQLACLEMIKAGITSFADSGGVFMEEAANVVIESGIRAAICRSTMDIGSNIPDSMKESVQDHMRHNQELHKAFQGAGEGRLDIWFGLRQVMTCSPELIRETAEQAKSLNTRIHAHLCEHKDEVSFCLQNYKKRPAAFLDDCGALGSNLLTAHNVTLSEGDITLLKERDVKIIHCPQANLSNHGFPKTPRIVEAGLSVGIGNDGASSVALDMFEQLRVLKNGVIAFWGLPVFDPVVLPTETLLKMSSQGGAAALGKEDKLGAIAPGMLADIILIDINQPHFRPSQNLAHTLIACGSGRDVTDVIINGKLIMEARNVLTLDEEKILSEAETHMHDIIKRANI